MVEDSLRSLAGHLRGSGALRAARDHSNLRDWLAVTATAWWRGQSGWDVCAGTVPYVSAASPDSWCDVYARRRDGNGTRLHLLAELRAVPVGAANGRRSVRAFAHDMAALAACDAAATRRCWRDGVNPRTGKPEASWFRRVPWFPSAADEGRLAGAGFLLLALSDAALLDEAAALVTESAGDRARVAVRDPALVPGATDEPPLACLAYAVDIAESA